MGGAMLTGGGTNCSSRTQYMMQIICGGMFDRPWSGSTCQVKAFLNIFYCCNISNPQKTNVYFLVLHLYIDISVDLCFLHVLGRSPGGTLFTSTYAAGIVCRHLRIPAGLCPCLRGSWKQAQMKVKVKGKVVLCHNRAPSYTCLSDVHQNILPFIFQFVTRFWNWR